MVMKIPGPICPGIFYGTNGGIPDGTCGTVLEGEGDLTYWDHLMVPYVGYGCYVHFPSCPSPNEKGWFVNRPRLMKISPEKDLEEESISTDTPFFPAVKKVEEPLNVE
jgi:hypothetical protein